MLLNELPGYSMSTDEIVEIVKRSCERWGVTLLKINCNKEILRTLVLIGGDSDKEGEIELDVDTALEGFADPITFDVMDNELSDEIKGPCPATIVMTNNSLYKEICKTNGGEDYVFEG